MATLGSLVVELGANVAKLQTDMQRAVSVVDRAAGGIKRAAGLATVALGAIGAGVSLASIAGAARQVIDLGDKLRDLSFATGQSVEQLSFLDFAAGQSGTSIETISSAAQRLSKNLVEIASGRGAQAAGALQKLGLEADELSRTDLAQQIGQIGSQLVKIDNPAQRAAIGVALFGKQFKELAPLILEGEEGVTKLVDRFIELGGTITRDQADKFDEFNDSLGELSLASRAAGLAVAEQLAPPLTSFFRLIADGVPKAAPALRSLGDALDEFVLNGARRLESFTAKFERFKAELFDSERFARNADQAERAVAEIDRKARQQRSARRTGREETDVSARRAAVLNPFLGATGIDPQIDPEAAAKTAERAAREAQRVADALERESDSVRSFLQDYAREREQSFQAEVEQSKRRIESLRESIRTPRERASAELAEFERVFGADSEEYGRKAVEVFNELEGTVGELDTNGQKLQTTFADLGATFSSAFEDAILGGEKFSDVLAGLGKDIARLLLRQTVTDPIAEFFSAKSIAKGGGGISGMLSSIFGGFRAAGGPVAAGRAYVVGERGPELLIPGSAGTIVPNGADGVVVNVHNYSSEPVRTEQNGARGVDVFVGASVTRAAAQGMLAPIGVRTPLVQR